MWGVSIEPVPLSRVSLLVGEAERGGKAKWEEWDGSGFSALSAGQVSPHSYLIGAQLMH